MPAVYIDIETSGLDPSKDFITMIGLLGDFGLHCISSPSELFRSEPLKAERDLLERFGKIHFGTNANDQDFLVSFNGKGFDLPFTHTRLLVHNLPEPKLLRAIKHYDLMRFASELNGTRISKDMAASKFCNLYVPRNSNGAFLASIYSQQIVTESEHVGTMLHNAQDLRVTQQMFECWEKWPLFKKHCESKGI